MPRTDKMETCPICGTKRLYWPEGKYTGMCAWHYFAYQKWAKEIGKEVHSRMTVEERLAAFIEYYKSIPAIVEVRA